MMRIITVILFLLIAAPAFSQIGMTLRRDVDTTGGGGFRPDDLDNMGAWWDAADIDNDGIENEESNGSTVSTWSDKSGNGCDCTGYATPTISANFYNSNHAVNLGNGNEYFLTGACSSLNFTDLTIFVVCENDDNPSDVEMIYAGNYGAGASSNSNRTPLLFSNTQSTYDYGGAHRTSGGSYVGVDINPAGIANTDLAIVELRIDGSTDLEIEADGTTGTNATATGSMSSHVRSAIGRNAHNTNNPYDGKVAEVIIYTDLLTSQEIDDVRTYLNNKWGL